MTPCWFVICYTRFGEYAASTIRVVEEDYLDEGGINLL
jgi:hypothetical protein